MTTKRIPVAATVLLATALGAGTSLAQGNQTQAPQAPAPQHARDQGMMGHGGMMGQMDQAQMNRMMENCNRMMEGMQRSPSVPQGAQPGRG